MRNIILKCIAVILTSFYFFPFEFKFLPGINTKMVLAALGLVLCGINISRRRNAKIEKSFIILSCWALAISAISFIATVINGTTDPSYVTYFMSMWVWLGGAYFVINVIKTAHDRVDAELVCYYLIVVCVFQCVLAFSMEQYPPLKRFIDSFLASEGFMGRVEKRLYGLGASLDVAGIKFAAVLATIAFLIYYKNGNSKSKTFLLVMAFCIISIIGNMIGRTTTIGIILSFLFWIFIPLFSNEIPRIYVKNLAICLTIMLLIFVPVSVYAYNTNAGIRKNLRFGFEGFFSLVEKGRWETNSTDILIDHMIVFPDNLKTWIIGDGYMANPDTVDRFYTGPSYHGFYKSTDIGYIRFLFYFGIIGLLVMISYMLTVGQFCMEKCPGYSKLFFLILMINFLCWFKVSTDLFVYFALFLCLRKGEWNSTTEIPSQ